MRMKGANQLVGTLFRASVLQRLNIPLRLVPMLYHRKGPRWGGCWGSYYPLQSTWQIGMQARTKGGAVLNDSNAVWQADDAEADSEKQAADGASLAEQLLDLSPYINSSAVRVDRAFSLLRAYMVFRTLGLRHLIITDAANHVRGIVTRKDLLGYRLDAAVHKYSHSRRQPGIGRRTSSFMSSARS